LADVLFRMGKPEKAWSSSREALAGSQLNETPTPASASAHQLKRYPEAAARMEQAIAIGRQARPAALYLSQAYRALGRSQTPRGSGNLRPTQSGASQGT